MRRPTGSFIFSIAVHVVVLGLFVQALVMQRPLLDLFRRGRPTPESAERVAFVSLPSAARVTSPGRAGGDNRPDRGRPAPPLVAPRTVPTVIPPRPRAAAEPETGTGPLVGGGGAKRGVQPSYSDPRLWSPPGRIATVPRTPAQQLDSVIIATIGPFNDSVAAARSGRAPGDWTFEKNGRKYGVDQKYIRLGPVSIPTAVLALLPLNVGGGQSMFDRANSSNGRSAEIFAQAQRGINEADFQKAVRSIRERKERERSQKERERSQAGTERAAPVPSPVPAESRSN